MALNQRRVKILHLIREDGHAKVQDLSKIFNVTDVTIRQDLEALEQMGYIQREHGGAFLKGVGSFAKTGQLFNQTHLEEKKEIAQKAIQFIQEGDSIIPVSYTHLSSRKLSLTCFPMPLSIHRITSRLP